MMVYTLQLSEKQPDNTSIQCRVKLNHFQPVMHGDAESNWSADPAQRSAPSTHA